MSLGRVLLAAFAIYFGVGHTSFADASKASYRTLDGHKVSLKAPTGGATVVVFYSTECPISNYYSPTLNAIAAAHPSDRLQLIGACVDPDVTADAARAHAREYQLKFPIILDPRGALARALQVAVTPEVVVIDDQGHTRYQGRIDDQYADRRVKTTTPRTHELDDAVTALLVGQPVAVAKTQAVGCPLPEFPNDAAPKVTYARNVAAIIDRNCVECHRPGQIGPFALQTYEQVSKRAEDIVSVTSDRLMPPWRATPGFGPAMRHDRSLTSDELSTLAAWADAGAPEGDPSERPAPPSFNDGWKLGTPDLVIEMAEPYDVPASGGDIYRCFVVPTDLPEDIYISGVEYRPGNPRVVHHILGYVDISGAAKQKDDEEPGAGYTCFGGPGIGVNNDLGGWAPGAEPDFLPEGVGRSLPKGAHVVMQVHYHPNGKPESDRSQIGLYFSKKPVRQTFHWAFVNPDRLDLPAGQKAIEVRAERTLPVAVDAVAVSPHMHMLGTDMTMWADLPDGRRIDLIKIDRWDFQWQNQYYYEHSIELPKGTVLRLIAHFDNSSDNPRNPNRAAPIDVHWGEATTDEMCIGFIGLTKAGQDLTKAGEHDDLRKVLDNEEGRGERQRRQRRR